MNRSGKRRTGASDHELGPAIMGHMPDRLQTYKTVSTALKQLSDTEIAATIADATHRGEGIGGPTYQTSIAGTEVFIKRVPLPDLERQHHLSTANLFDLPVHYQYGVGSAGFSAWRELSAHRTTTEWVMTGECGSFPLLYDWRILPREPQASNSAEAVAWWEGDERIGRRLNAIDEASASIVLFLEFVPRTVNEWLRENPTELERVEAELLHAVDVMNDHGMLHFDAHFYNVLADDDRIYISDFGLATATSFELSAAERAFIGRHLDYDRAISSLMLAVTAARLQGHDDPAAYLRQVAAGAVPSDGVLARHAAAAVVLQDFFDALRTSKRSAYPEEEMTAALAAG